MYCRQCGKWVEDDAELCKDCQTVEDDGFFSDSTSKTAAQQPAAPVKAVTGSRKEGIGKAIPGLILGVLASIFSAIGWGLVLGVEQAALMEDVYTTATSGELLREAGLFGVTLGFALVSLGMAVAALILGILSISCFKKAGREGRVRPIPTLIMGIAGVATAAESLLIVLIVFIGLI